MQQLWQTFLPLGLLLESHDLQEMFDRESKKIEAELDNERRSKLKEVTTESVECASRRR